MLLSNWVDQVSVIPTQEVVDPVNNANAHLQCIARFLARHDTEFHEFRGDVPSFLFDGQIT